MSKRIDPHKIYAIDRPESVLLVYFFLQSLASLIFFPLIFPPLLIRYLTLSYTFDEESIRKSYGLIFKKEELVQYARIQDLHLKCNLLQRWLGLGTLEVQTAAGSAAAEMVIEGLTIVDEVRDFLYARMRGARFGEEDPGTTPTVADVDIPGQPPLAEEVDEAVLLLTEIRDELRQLRGRRP